MAEIIFNERLTADVYLMRLKGSYQGQMGQFYMLRSWERYPVLSRPLSIFDLRRDYIAFLYQVVGEGTELFSRLRAGDHLKLEGPFGNGFPQKTGRIALVGGGMGVAPLYLTARSLKCSNSVKGLDIYLGFRDYQLVGQLQNLFRELADELVIEAGGFITEQLNVDAYDYIFSCGPEPMLEELVRIAAEGKAEVYTSIEGRMACGIGVCLACNCETKDGNRKVCKDGPVFPGREIYG